MKTNIQKYPAYKDSGVEWLGKIPNHWEIIRLKNIIRAKITDGPHVTPEFIDEGIPFLSVDGIQNGELVFENSRLISLNDHIKYQKKCRIEKFDILMGKAASIGKIAQSKVDFEYSIWSPLALIKPNLEKFNATFMEYYLKSTLSQYQIEILCTSNTQKNISMDDIPKIILTFPPLPEQTAIAAFLDRKTTLIDQAIGIKQKQIELLKERRQILIHNAVTRGLNPNVKLKDSGVEWIGEIPEHWEVRRIKTLTRVKRGASPRPIDDPRYFNDNGEFAWVRIADVSSNDHYLINTVQKLSKLGSSLSVKILPNELFISIAGTVGKPMISKIKCCIHDGFVYFPDLKMNLEYMYRIFETGQPYLGLGKHGTQLNLNTETIGNIYIPLPPANIQNEIVCEVNNISIKFANAISLKEQEIEKLKEYKATLINSAVTGKIKVC